MSDTRDVVARLGDLIRMSPEERALMPSALEETLRDAVDLLARAERAEAVVDAVLTLHKYEDFEEPVTCPECAPLNRLDYDIAQLNLYEAIKFYKDVTT